MLWYWWVICPIRPVVFVLYAYCGLEYLACNINVLFLFYLFLTKLYLLIVCRSTEYFKIISREVTADTKKESYSSTKWKVVISVKLCV